MSKKETEPIEQILTDVEAKKAGKAGKGGETVPQGGTETGAEEAAAVEAQVIEPEIVAAPANNFLHQIYEEAIDDQPVEPLGELIRRSAAEAKPGSEADNANLPAVRSGSDSPDTGPTVKEMVDKIKGIITSYVGKGLEEIGAYILTNVFGGNYTKALSRDPYKGTSLNDLARHKDMPLSRPRLGECIRAAGMSKELAASGVNAEALTFYHKVEISKVRSQEARVKLAKKIVAESLTVRETSDRVRRLIGKPASQDKRLAQSLVKQMRKLSGITVSDDIREFLTDKDRLKAALSTGEAATLLGHSEKFRGSIDESREVLQQFEKTLVELVIEARQGDTAEAKPEADETAAV
ncbi:MAG: hypothetical protein ACLP5H_02290 [Desulfomonilaceae bacterium]